MRQRCEANFRQLDREIEWANSLTMDALVLGPAIVASFTLSLFTGKLVLRAVMSRILR